MCYKDDDATVLHYACPDEADGMRLDCNHDDYYYNTNPSPGTYLATEYNVADNLFLIKEAASTTTTASPSASPSPSVTTSPSASPSPPAQRDRQVAALHRARPSRLCNSYAIIVRRVRSFNVI